MTTENDDASVVGRRGFFTIVGATAAVSCGGSAPRPQSSQAALPGPTLSSATGTATATSSGTVPRRRLGRTGAVVSMIGVGGYHLGRTKDEGEAIRIVRTAVDRGVDFMDNSWDYNGGVSEERLGKALADGYRDRAFVMTKLDGRTAASANGQLEQSLRRLRTNHIDLLQVHEVIRMTDPARVFDKGGAMEAIVAAQKAGKIRFIGFTGHKDPKIHLAMLKMADDHGFRFDTVQMPVNVMDWHYRSFQKEVLPVLLQKEIGVLGMKSMGDHFILDSGVASARDLLRYSLSTPVSVQITGIDSMAILNQALDVATHFEPMNDAERQAILGKAAALARDGSYERFKTSTHFDSTTQHPEWLQSAQI
jgi:diketogulonate reductase-like aldo/keto reductase